MPTYCYKADAADSDCPICSDGFETVQGLSEPPLTTCPTCEAGVHRIVRRPPVCVTSVRWNEKKLLSDGNLKKNGFKKLVKQGDGKYRDVLAD